MSARTGARRIGSERGFDAAFALCAAMALLFPALNLAVGDAARDLVIVAACILPALVVWWGRRRWDNPLPYAAVFVLAVAATVLPSEFGFGVMLLLVVLAALTARYGLGAGVPAAALTLPPLVVVSGIDGAGIAVFVVVWIGLVALFLTLGVLVRRNEAVHAEMERSQAELRSANQRLQRALEIEGELVLAQERARAARELHDGLGHSLTVLSMTLQLAQRRRGVDEEAAWTAVAEAGALTAEALADMRLWVRALDPPVAAAVGGPAGADAIAESFRDTGLEVRVSHVGDTTPLPERPALFATRFLQEGLTNVLRHAAARSVEIDIRRTPAQLRIAITDDGQGDEAPREGFGLRSLRQRALELDGEVRTGPGPAGGFAIVATLPLLAEPVMSR